MTKWPLSWPAGWKRTDSFRRGRAKFQKLSFSSGQKLMLSVAQGTERVLDELRRFGIAESTIIVSTNLVLRIDGLPRSDQREPGDPGVAVYWKAAKDRTHKVLAVDRYDRVADNLAAVAATLEAMRAIERHGGAVILERAFTGFDALPSPNDWRHVLGFDGTPGYEQAKARYQSLAMKHHPDVGGSEDRMVELNRAWEDAQRELK